MTLIEAFNAGFVLMCRRFRDTTLTNFPTVMREPASWNDYTRVFSVNIFYTK